MSEHKIIITTTQRDSNRIKPRRIGARRRIAQTKIAIRKDIAERGSRRIIGDSADRQ